MPVMRRRDLLLRSTSALWIAALASTGGAAWAAWANNGAELARLLAQYDEEGLTLSYEVRFDLHRDVEQMLSKGIAVVFMAQAEVFEKRWYWTDRRIASATRRWRLAYQPLTRQWRLNFDGFSRPYSRLSEALEVLRQGSRWLIAEQLGDVDPADCHVDFRFLLDASELPRPLQIGLGGQADWALQIERRVGVTPAR